MVAAVCVPADWAVFAALRRSDNGGASFLGQVFAAVKGMADSQQWVLISVPRLHEPHLQLLAEAQGCDLPALVLPAGVPVVFPEGASQALVSLWGLRGRAEGGQSSTTSMAVWTSAARLPAALDCM